MTDGFREATCVGGKWDGYLMNYPDDPEQVTRVGMPYIEPCQCVGIQVYDLWGELAIAAFYEPPKFHCLTDDYSHPVPK